MSKRRAHGHDRRGRAGAYIIVLGSALLVSVIGLSALTAQRLELRVIRADNASIQARLHARSAVEIGLLSTALDASWRTSLGGGAWADHMPLGSGSFSLQVSDPVDGDVGDSPDDPIVFTATGYQDDARHVLQVTLMPRTDGLACLEVALLADTNLYLNQCTLSCDQTIAANAGAMAWLAQVDSDVEAVSAVWGSTYNGTQTSGVPARTMPDAGVYDYYVSAATTISITSIPNSTGKRLMDEVLLSPASNPYEAQTNTEGIYLIDCQKEILEIQNSRIVGTLVLQNPGPGTTINGSVNWEPAVTNYPALLVAGQMAFSFDGNDLIESTTNFNPSGTPYLGSTDNDTNDRYPSVVKGVVYVGSSASFSGFGHFEGVVVVSGQATIRDSLDLVYDGTYLNNPPPGFQGPPHMAVASQSWKQLVD